MVVVFHIVHMQSSGCSITSILCLTGRTGTHSDPFLLKGSCRLEVTSVDGSRQDGKDIVEIFTPHEQTGLNSLGHVCLLTIKCLHEKLFEVLFVCFPSLNYQFIHDLNSYRMSPFSESLYTSFNEVEISDRFS